MPKLTMQQTVILYSAIGVLDLSFIASLVVAVFYLMAYPDRMMPVIIIGFLQAVLTSAGVIIGVIMGVHLPFSVPQQLTNSSQT